MNSDLTGEYSGSTPGPTGSAELWSSENESVPMRFARQVQAHSHVFAIVDGEDRLTYRELDRRSNGIAQTIREQCPEECPRVAILTNRVSQAIPMMLGALKMGALYVPLDPASPEARLALMLEDADVAIVFTDATHRGLAERLVGSTRPIVECEWQETEWADATLPGVVSADALAYILYTSGSTGQPKGVVQTQRNLIHFIDCYSKMLGIRAGDRLSLFYSLSFSASLMDIYGALLNGATIYRYDVKSLGLHELPMWLRQNGITIYHSVPTVFRHLMDTLADGEHFPKIRAVDLGGEPVFRRDVEAFRKHFAPDCLLVNHLAFTEASVTAQLPVYRDMPLPADRIGVGFPAAGMTVWVRDTEGNALGADEIGELVVQSRYLSPGYWGQPELTAASFSVAGNSEERNYYTGDLGRILADGRIEHLGRKDSRIKLRGYTIEVAEIEQALLRLAAVKEAVVVAREIAPGDARLVAYLVLHGTGEPSSAQIREALATMLPDYMLPSAYVFLEALPITESGKVNARALPMPSEWHSTPTGNTPTAPRTETEVLLLRLWKELLKLEAIGVEDSFFVLGGHSLLAARLFVRIEQEFGIRLPLSSLLHHPTITTLAPLIEAAQADSAPWSSLVAIQPAGTRPAFFCVHALGPNLLDYRLLAQHLGPDQPFYGFQSVGLDGLQEPLSSVDEMAAHYIAEMRKVQPRGPYRLGGRSAGGIIAYEMAQQLEAAGEGVALLALIDTVCRAKLPHYIPTGRILKQLDIHIGTMLYKVRKKPVPYLAGWLRSKLPAALGGKPIGVRPLPGAIPSLVQEVADRNQSAVRSYEPRSYRGHITQFLASEMSHRTVQDPRLGWSVLAEKGLEVHFVGGNHDTMMEEPHVTSLAATLRRCLDRAMSDNPG